MRTKQCAIRRLANSNSEEEEETTTAGSPLHSPVGSEPRPQSQPQLQLSLLATTINGQQQLEDGTIVVQPEAAEATEGNQTDCFDHPASVARCSAPGIYDTVKCTACGKRVNPYNGTMEVHPLLKVLVCHKCYKFYDTGHFDADEDGKENQCRWCGEGGSLICCDNCEHSFCRTCIKRNLGRSALQDIESLPDESVWLCYACDQGALRNLQDEANIVMKAVRDHFKEANKRSEKQKVSQAKKAVAPSPQQLQLKHQNHIQVIPSLSQQQQRPVAAPVQVSSSPAIAAYGSLRGSGGITTTIGGIQLDLSAVPKVSAATAAARLPNQQAPLQPHRQQPHQNNNQLSQQLQQAGAATVTQRTEQWYKQNVRIETILSDIESVDTRNIGTALNATVSLLQGMMRQYSRFMQDLTMATTQVDKGQIVSRFKSAYRMHLFLRLGKLRSLIAEEDKHLMRKSAAAAVASGRTAPASSAFIDLTGSTHSAASAKPVQPGLLLPLQARVAARPQQQRPQPQVSQVSSVSAAAHAQRQLPTRQRSDCSSTGASVHPSGQPPPPHELVVVLSDDEDNDDENNNNNVSSAGGSQNGDASVAAGNTKDQRAASTQAATAVDAATVSAPTVSAIAATATANGGKPAAILELLEARRRREKCSRKPQQPRRLAAATCSADGDGEDSNSADAVAEETTSSIVAPLSEPERPASTSSSSSLSVSASGGKRHHTVEDDGPEGATDEVSGPPSGKRRRENDEIAAPAGVLDESTSADEKALSPSNGTLHENVTQVAATAATS